MRRCRYPKREPRPPPVVILTGLVLAGIGGLVYSGNRTHHVSAAATRTRSWRRPGSPSRRSRSTGSSCRPGCRAPASSSPATGRFVPRFLPGVNLGSTVPGREPGRGERHPARDLRPLAARDGPARRPRRARLHDPAAAVLRGARRLRPAHPARRRPDPGRLDPGARAHRERRRLRARGDRRVQDGDRATPSRSSTATRSSRSSAATPAAATAPTSRAGWLPGRSGSSGIRSASRRPTGDTGCRPTTGTYITADAGATADGQLARVDPRLHRRPRDPARLEPPADVHELDHHRPAAARPASRTPRRTRSRSTRRRCTPRSAGPAGSSRATTPTRTTPTARSTRRTYQLPAPGREDRPLRRLPPRPARLPQGPGRDDHRVRRADQPRRRPPRAARPRPGRPLRAGGRQDRRRHAARHPGGGHGRRR